jgi:GAF domain-containing protein
MALSRFNVIAVMAVAISSSTEYETVLKTVVQTTGTAFEVFECVIYEYIEGVGTTTAMPQALWSLSPTPEDEAYVGVPVALYEEPALEKVLRTKKIVATRIDDPDLPDADRRLMDEWGEKSCLWIPLVFGGHIIGCLELVERRYARPFTDYDFEFAKSVAALAAMAVNNARSLRRETQMEERFRVLLAASLDLALAGDDRELLDTLARTTGAALLADACYISLYDPVAEALVWVAGWEPAAMEQVSDDRVGTAYPLADYPTDRRAIEQGEVIERWASDPDLRREDAQDFALWGFKTVLSVPAIVDGQPIAMLEVVQIESERRFTADELEVARTLGAQAAAVLKRRMADGPWTKSGESEGGR